jgi:molybdate transport system substrate-binding protein
VRRLALVFILACKRDTSEVTVAAAISLKEVMDEVATTTPHLSMVYGASGDLVTQMERGSPFELLASAGEEPRLAKLADERCTLAWNTLVLVKHRGSRDVDWSTLGTTPGTFRLAIGLAPQVPVGVYAEEALRKLGVWSAIEPKLVRGTNVRNVLDLVARGEADAGIVYATDTKVRSDVDVMGEVPAFALPNVRYPLYVARNAAPASRGVADLLCGNATKRVLVAHGFRDRAP